MNDRVYTENLFWKQKYAPIESSAKFSGVINPIKPLWLDFNIKTYDSIVWPKKPVFHRDTVSILTGRKKIRFSHICSSVITYLIGTKFATEVSAR